MKTVEELKKEQYEVKAKLHELVEFVNSEEFYSMSKPEQALAGQERTGLELCLNSLTKRVYGNPKEPDNSGMPWLALMYGMFSSSTGPYYPASSNSVKDTLEERDFDEETLADHAA